MNRKWYVLRSKPNKEVILWRELTAHGFDCFYPQLHVRPVHPRSRTVRPYFPGYLFLHVDMEETVTSMIQWMPFSSGFISFGGLPATVPDNLIQAICKHVNDINAAGIDQVAGLQRGEEVIIEGGPFAGYEAIFNARISGEDRVRVLLKLLSRKQVPLVLPSSQIQRKKG